MTSQRLFPCAKIDISGMFVVGAQGVPKTFPVCSWLVYKADITQ